MEALAEHGISLRDYNVGDKKTTCPQCSHTRKNKKDQCLSITLETDGGAVWKCHHCEWSGAIAGDNYRRDVARTQEINRNNIVKVFKKPEPPKQTVVSDGVKTWFAKRNITEGTIEDYGCYRAEVSFGSAPEPCIAFPYFEDGVLVNVKYRTQDKRFRQEGGTKRTLFGIDKVKQYWEQTSEKVVVFVEGEMDVLALWESGINYATTLPDGAPKQAKFDPNDKRFEALQNCEWLDDAEKVIIATDGDEAGKALALELVHRFGKDRCWTVAWSNLGDVECKDANETLMAHGSEVVAECISNATPHPIDGLYTVSDYKNEVLNIYHGNIQKPVSTGFANLDDIYKVMPSTFCLVTGIPNHGKSNFIDQLAVNLMYKEGWKFAIFSPEHSSANHIRRFAEKVVKKPFDVGPNPRMSEDDVVQAMEFLDNKVHFIETNDSVPTIDWLLGKARAACLRHGVKGIIIDPYNEIDASRDGNKREDEHIRDLISKCKSFCRKHDIVMWMVAHPAKMQRQADGAYPPPSLYDVSGSAHWNNMCDVGLVVHRDFENEETRVITRKIREQGLYGSIGEVFFRYNLITHSYEPSIEMSSGSQSYRSYGDAPDRWMDND